MEKVEEVEEQVGVRPPRLIDLTNEISVAILCTMPIISLTRSQPTKDATISYHPGRLSQLRLPISAGFIEQPMPPLPQAAANY